MYELYYKFTAEPFRLSPDHRFCFEHKSYGKARAYMAYAFKRAEGFVMITGRPGTGKTTLIGELVESLSKDKVVTANLVCTQLQADDLLKTVAYSFGISPAQVGKAELLQRLNILLHRWHREGRRALLVVDEAQDLSSSAMEELRLLTNIQFGGQPLLQIFLLGQPELRDLILSAEMEQVHQRIVAASHIEGLEEDETEAYVIHRLSVVGWQGNPAIDRAIFPYIHKFSEGVPRRINLICSRLFLLGSVEERDVIGVADVRVVIGELQAENLAAGTGISQADFHHGAEPEWAPVPVNESQLPRVPHLQEAGSALPTPVAYADPIPVDQQPLETKKKDIPRLEPLTAPVADSESGIPSVAVAQFEFVPEDDATIAESPNDDVVVLNDQLAASSDHDVTFVTDSAGVVRSPVAPRRRYVVTALLLVVVIALFLLLKACFVTPDLYASSFLELEKPVPMGDGEAAVAPPVLGGDQVHAAATVSQVSVPSSPDRLTQEYDISTASAGSQVNAADKVGGAQGNSPSDSEPNPDTSLSMPLADVPVKEQDLQPIVVEATRLPGQLATLVAGDAFLPGESALHPETAGRHENDMAVHDVSVSEDKGAVPAGAAVVQDGEQEIFISFPFDSDVLIPDSHLALDKAATVLQAHASIVASITGFTDSKGDSHYNLVLSRKRANAVERYLVDAGIARERLHVEGRGVLVDPLQDESPGDDVSREPYRIVRIKLGSDG